MEVRPQFDWASFWQALFSILATICLWTLAGGIGVLAAAEHAIGTPFLPESTSVFSLIWLFFFLGCFSIPSAYFAIHRLINGPTGVRQNKRNTFYLIPILLLAWILTILAGSWVIQKPTLTHTLFPLINILSVGFPILAFILIGQNALNPNSNQRSWGVFNSGLLLGSIFCFAFEIAMIGILIGVIFLVIASRPEWIQEMVNLSVRLEHSNLSPQIMGRIMEPYLSKSWVIYTVIAVGAGFIPLLEELLKPIGVWLLANRQLSPAEGFTAGLLSGAGYALFESLGASGSLESGEWVTVIIARAGTSLLHVLTTGLMGWALACAWRQRTYLRLGVTYLICVLIHAIWNGLSFLMGFAAIVNPVSQSSIIGMIGPIVPVGLAILAIVMVSILWRANRSLQTML